jgi:hypothetical protein
MVSEAIRPASIFLSRAVGEFCRFVSCLIAALRFSVRRTRAKAAFSAQMVCLRGKLEI